MLEWYAANASGAVREPAIFGVRAVVAFLDVSGFTPMTERLSERGPVGAELVCAILSEYFSALLEVVLGWGGDVIKFAGDALLVSFRVGNGCAMREAASTEEARKAERETAERAVACALEVTRVKFERHGVALSLKVRRPWCAGRRSRVQVALGVGDAYMVHVGKDERWEVFLAGTPLHQIAAAEHDAAIGATIVSPELWQVIQGCVHSTEAPAIRWAIALGLPVA